MLIHKCVNPKPLTTNDIDKLFDHIDNEKMIREFECWHCGRKTKLPIVAREDDVLEFHKLKQVIYNYLDDHPEIAQSMMDDLINRLLDAFEGQK